MITGEGLVAKAWAQNPWTYTVGGLIRESVRKSRIINKLHQVLLHMHSWCCGEKPSAFQEF